MGSSRSNDKQVVIQPYGDAIQVVSRNAGVAGEPGVAGANATAANWNPRGAWSSATSYSVRDVVVHRKAQSGDGNTYICLQAHTNQPPSSNPLYWAQISEAAEGPVSLSLGPYLAGGSSILGFVNQSIYQIDISEETVNGGGTIDWREVNGSPVTTFPLTLEPGDLFEVRVIGVLSPNRTYVSYRVDKGS